mmetsp:Transcript_14526/g.31696  ORF Transcript_14526/g.31696 Transcript_14526/m.31696 type:complete len:204 (-) Transcript_14526:372-983(-)
MGLTAAKIFAVSGQVRNNAGNGKGTANGQYHLFRAVVLTNGHGMLGVIVRGVGGIAVKVAPNFILGCFFFVGGGGGGGCCIPGRCGRIIHCRILLFVSLVQSTMCRNGLPFVVSQFNFHVPADGQFRRGHHVAPVHGRGVFHVFLTALQFGNQIPFVHRRLLPQFSTPLSLHLVLQIGQANQTRQQMIRRQGRAKFLIQPAFS